MNRDDAPARIEAPPRIWRDNSVSYLAPLDLQSEGTWIAVNVHGVAACLLNRYDAASPGARSRGQIIPSAMDARNACEAAERIDRLDHSQFSPFTCLLLAPDSALRMDWNGKRLESEEIAKAPWMVTSSSWNLAEVHARRAALFESTVRGATGDPPRALSAFHCRHDPVDDVWAPLMMRQTAQTISVTQIAIEGRELEMRYWPRTSAIAKGLADPDVSISIWPLC